MGLSFLAPLWFELLVVVLLVGRSQWDRRPLGRGRAEGRRREPPQRGPVEIAVLLLAGAVVVGLIRTEHLAVAAAVLTLLVLADAAWVGSRPAQSTEPSRA